MSRRKKLFVTAAIVLLVALGMMLLRQRPAPKTPRQRERAAESRRDPVREARPLASAKPPEAGEEAEEEEKPRSRCGRGAGREIRLQRLDEVIWIKTNDELFELPEAYSGDHRVRATGKEQERERKRPRKERRMIRLHSLIPTGQGSIAAIDLVPCFGDAWRFPMAELDENPDRYVLMQNKRGVLKLTDRVKNSPMVVKNLYSIDLIPYGDPRLDGPRPGIIENDEEDRMHLVIDAPGQELKTLTRVKIRSCGEEGCPITDFLPPDVTEDYCIENKPGMRLRMRPAILTKSRVWIPERGPGLLFYPGGVKGAAVNQPLSLGPCDP
ncbi:MAG: hypothetical protein KIT79_09370 [Deltaproteobacteria bacterium]|nr:hypothetical protein [Deltaproteobacteria bacterium]